MSDNPDWLKDDETKTIDLVSSGIILIKRVFQAPANTADEAKAARNLGKMIFDLMKEANGLK